MLDRLLALVRRGRDEVAGGALGPDEAEQALQHTLLGAFGVLR